MAQTAINAVGEKRIINCIKTMMFMTPESRGNRMNYDKLKFYHW